jgi:hypothetical protein
VGKIIPWLLPDIVRDDNTQGLAVRVLDAVKRFLEEGQTSTPTGSAARHRELRPHQEQACAAMKKARAKPGVVFGVCSIATGGGKVGRLCTWCEMDYCLLVSETPHSDRLQFLCIHYLCMTARVFCSVFFGSAGGRVVPGPRH